MRRLPVQTSLWDIYDGVSQSMEQHKPRLIALLEKHIHFEQLIPPEFRWAYYSRMGRKPVYHLESILRALVLQKILGIPTDSLLLSLLHCCKEFQDFCGFRKIPDASKLSRFREQYKDHLSLMFDRLVERTEPVCQKISKKLASYLIYDTSGIELPVKENNPKFFSSKLRQARQLGNNNPGYDPYKGVYALLPKASATNPEARNQYINGHFCYAAKFGILTNGLGICRHIEFFDNDFRQCHPEMREDASGNPDADKELGDSTSLKPVLSGFFSAHPGFSYKTFIGDAAFDSYKNYTLLKDTFHFQQACIPLNTRNTQNLDACLDESGAPVCPVDQRPFTYLGKCGGKNRSTRYKWVCPESRKNGASRICTCEHPCTPSPYGRCVYTHQDSEFRACPGIPRDTEQWDKIYRHRVTVERTIFLFKDTFVLDARKSHRTVSAKADLYLAGIVQLIGVLLADALHKPEYIRSVRKLLAA